MLADTKILLYDDYCPLCTWYSNLFVKYGLLIPGNRVPFSTADPEVLSAIDLVRGKDEIPLFDASTKTTLYGIDALLEILGHNFPLIKLVGHQKQIKSVLTVFYKVISYNRKVIVARRCGKGQFDCSPAFDPFYRMVFMIFFLCFNSIMLSPVHSNILIRLPFYHLSFCQLQVAHLIFVTINCLLAIYLGKQRGIEFLGQANMLALITILLLIPLIVACSIISIPAFLTLAYLSAVTVVIIKEYHKRMKYAGILSSNEGIVWLNISCLAAFLIYVFH